ncbi:hypothetical protein [Citrobacter freundii]|uniref:Uncharacterized protein n=1 Tax=Citrobacter freundii TaxID=546 RepID=A0AAN4EXR8_CITFR|nr:hypothetical protein [Citrobacter freundii]EKW2111753.1 hypothetical protein [Citrobacter freundii]
MTTNHPAHGPVSLDRLHQISEILSKASAQSDGGNLGYAMADAVKVIDLAIAAFGAEPVAIKCHVPHEAKGRIDPDEPNYSDGYRVGWNSCRAAMLQAGNSPATPDGWQLVPKKITLEMECAISRADSYEIGWQWALAAAPKYEVK